jgi:hypothetical protein
VPLEVPQMTQRPHDQGQKLGLGSKQLAHTKPSTQAKRRRSSSIEIEWPAEHVPLIVDKFGRIPDGQHRVTAWLRDYLAYCAEHGRESGPAESEASDTESET